MLSRLTPAIIHANLNRTMYVPERITDQIKSAKTRKEVIEIILEECFQEDLQEAALDWAESNRKDLNWD